jgi:hypothetical protein
VIIERLPAAPPRPRDIIIERWIPYGAMSKRKTIVQRAAAAAQYARPRNVIIQYEAPQVRIVRQFQRLGVVQANPQAYIQQYGASLFEAHILLQQARAAGVVEDISPPSGVNISSSSFSAEYASGSSGLETAGGGARIGGAGASSSSYETSGYGGQQGGATFSGFESAQGAGYDSGLAGGLSSSYESTSYASQGVAGGAGAAGESSYGSYGTSAAGYAGGFDPLAAAFNAADTNKDGTIDPEEFRRFVGTAGPQ